MTWNSRRDDVPTWSTPERTTTGVAAGSALVAANWNSNVEKPRRCSRMYDGVMPNSASTCEFEAEKRWT